jgi:peptidoglycan/xylan/chitin deacetylase (PgdA/CDA1 family)
MSIALYRDSECWRQFLQQEGVPVRSDWRGGTQVSVILLSAEPDKSDLTALRRMVERGAAVIGSARCVSAVWPEVRCRRSRLDYIVPDGSPLFRNVGIIDIGQTDWRAEAADTGVDESGRPAIASLSMGIGHVIALPFELARLAADTRAAERQFYVGSRRMAHEKVSRVGRGDVRRLLANCLRQMLWRRDEPYVHLAYQPCSEKTVFGVRIDTDDGPATSLRATAQLADKAGLKLSWFVNTGAPTVDLGYMRELHELGHDVQLHCRAHRVYREYERNLANIRAGVEDMRSAGLHPRGFVAPYGEWNEPLAHTLADSDMSYSSEFGYAYDDLPSFPIVGGRRSSVLQVPVHPVCLGLFRAAKTNPEAVAKHYRDYIELQVARREPCLIYDHPDTIERHADAFRAVLATGMVAASGTTTMTALADWWKLRLAARWQARLDEDGIVMEGESKDGDIFVAIELPERSASVPLEGGAFRYHVLPFKPAGSVTMSFEGDVRARRLEVRARLRFGTRAVTKSLQERRQRL